jgi:preprotein translocase subunit SecG
MGVFEIIGGSLIILMSIAIVILVLFQESPKGTGVSALTGGDSYYNKNQGRTLDAVLSRATKWLAVGFFVITIASSVAARFMA